MLTSRRRVFSCLAIVICVFIWFPSASVPSLVDLGYVRYQGIRNSKLGVTTFYGLHYAVPPTGKLRWQPPIPIDTSEHYGSNTLINATKPGNICYQSKPTWQKPSVEKNRQSGPLTKEASSRDPAHRQQSEDCLLLDVITPSKPASNSLPVVVFIHGGGYVKGHAAEYDGQNFVSFSKGSIIWVQIHYRLGLFGFLGGAEINASGSSNVGLLDQQLALKWVQNHIARFGGDPQRVTIWGGSAGGASVMTQMILHGNDAEAPFRAAIAEYPWWQPYHSKSVLDKQYKDLLILTSCKNLDCLWDLSGPALAKAQQGVYDRGWEAQQYGYGDFYFGPSVDGKVIQRLPFQSLEGGSFAKVPMLIDHAGFEGFTFTNKYINQHFVIPTYFERLWPQISHDLVWDVFRLYPEDNFTEQYFNRPVIKSLVSLDERVEENSAFFRAQAIFSDATINCPTRSMATAVTGAGQNVWKLQFNAGSQLHATITKEYILASENPHRSTSQLKSYFLAFITSLDPNRRLSHFGRGGPTWPVYASGGQVLLVDDGGISVTDDGDSSENCDIIASKHESFGY